MELRLEVRIDPNLDQGVRDAVAFGDFVLAPDNELGVVYPDNGLPLFYSELIMGRVFPLTFATRRVHSISTILAVALFLYRDLALHPRTPNLVTAATLTERFEYAGLAHIDRDLARFFKLLVEYLPKTLSRADQKTRLATAVGWIREYILEDRFPALPAESPVPRVLDQGTNGFVVAEMPDKRLMDGWIELFRMGHLRGLLVGPARDDRVSVLAARKSPYVKYDLQQAATLLNEAEQAMGEPPGWSADELWLWGPDEGTHIPSSSLIDVLVRV